MESPPPPNPHHTGERSPDGKEERSSATALLEREKPRQPRGRGRLIQLLIALLMVAALIGLATWWFFSRETESNGQAPTATSVPKDAVALINSSTPVPVRLPASLPDVSSSSMLGPPDADSWSPAVREANRALQEGRYSSAISQFSALVGAGQGDDARQALWGLAEAYAASGQSELALRTYLLYSGLDDPRAGYAAIRAAELYERRGQSAEAARIYQHFAKAGGPLRFAMLISAARLLGGTKEADSAYKAILDARPPDADLRQALVEYAELKSKRGEHAAARDLYDRLAALQNSSPRPSLDPPGVPAQVLAAGEARQAGDQAGARKRLLDYVNATCVGGSPCGYTAPGRQAALSALLQIDPSTIVSGTVPSLSAGQIAYAAGAYSDAISYLGALRAARTDAPGRATALLITGKAFDGTGDSVSAYSWYTSTIQAYPAAPEAAEAFRRAGDALSDRSQWDQAMAVYQEGIARYPTAAQSSTARLHAGVLAYRLDARDLALSLLQPVTTNPAAATDVRAEANFWTAKLQKGEGDPTWRAGLQQVSSLAPGTYLDFRARDLLAGEPEGGPVAAHFTDAQLSASDLGVRYSQEGNERSALQAWAANLTPVTTMVTGTTTSTVGLKATVTATRAATPVRTRVPSAEATGSAGGALPGRTALEGQDLEEAQRAFLLLQVGDDRGPQGLQALAERLRTDGNAEGLAEVVLTARYFADPRTGMRVASSLAAADPGGPLKRPSLLQKTLYPTPYGDLVLGESKAQDVDPLVMYALMRQESQFVPGARSGSDARGLTQVIPSTGEGIAGQLNDSGFSTGDLYLPYVSVRYGTYYLASNFPQFDRKLLPALAAYNGGPGNAARWLQGSALIDPDLFAERVDLFETGDYLERVYTNYGFYRLAYAR